MPSVLSSTDDFPETVTDEESRLTAEGEGIYNAGGSGVRARPILSRLQMLMLLREKTVLIFCVTAAVVSVAGIAIYKNRALAQVEIDWPDPAWMQELPRCQSTLFQPFRVGCPATCERAATYYEKNETMYRMHAAWYFGQAKLFPESALPIAYEMGINYQAPRLYIENFVEAARQLGDRASRALPNITVAPQEDIHMSLAYFCCLRKNETYWVREIMDEWVKKHRPFHFRVNFNKLECWHERYNSVTNIIVGDDATQLVVMKLVHELYKAIEDRGIPMEVTREQQMPIHATLIGLQYGAGEERGPEYDIRPSLDQIHEIVAPISRAFGDSWTGRASDGMKVSDDPRISEGAWHAGAKP